MCLQFTKHVKIDVCGSCYNVNFDIPRSIESEAAIFSKMAAPMASKKLELPSASSNSYASFVLSKLPACLIYR